VSGSEQLTKERLLDILREVSLEHLVTVRRPLRPFMRPFCLRFTYVTSVLEKY
jgi:hypothetical protein